MKNLRFVKEGFFKTVGFKMETKSALLVVLIAALLVTVGLQTVQLAALAGGGSGAFTVKTTASAKTGSSSSSSAGSSLQNLPSMVGGC